MPVSRDALTGSDVLALYAATCALAGEKELALQQLTSAVKVPGMLSYGQLKLLPYWDPLRGDPRFEQTVASLAPKD